MKFEEREVGLLVILERSEGSEIRTVHRDQILRFAPGWQGLGHLSRRRHL